ncbi:MAG: GNAT family N-acetyltransferase [Austwickia sp.]|jgi:GNAT superfamily N-acetyltransferase|nr:MAG: GNAT family N-acetyltransferase [Austwickia sp.]
MSRTHPDVGVRRAGPADADAVGAVQARLWRDAYAGDLPAEALEMCTAQAFADAWRVALSDYSGPDHVLLAAHEGSEIVGFAAISPSDDPDLAERGAVEITVAGVDPDRRGAGHGSRLLAAAADVARERGATGITVWVLAGHERTRAFLQGAGFGPDRARRTRVVDDAGATVLEARLATSLDPPGPDAPDPTR